MGSVPVGPMMVVGAEVPAGPPGNAIVAHRTVDDSLT